MWRKFRQADLSRFWTPIYRAPHHAAANSTLTLPAPTARDNAAVQANPGTAARLRAGTRQHAVFAGIVVIVLGVLAWGAWHAGRQVDGSPAQTSMPARSRIALVLPVTVNADSGHAWMRLGLMDLIAERLRATGLAVVPSDTIVALTSRSAGSTTIADPAVLAHQAGANLAIAAQAEAFSQHWRVSLRTAYGEAHLLAVGEAPDALAAARIATDHLAQQLGYTPLPDPSASLEPPELANLLQQVEAAILDERLDNARALLESLPPAQREQPQVLLRLAKIAYQAGDFTAAETGFTTILLTVSAEQDPVLRARALLDLGVIAAMHDNTSLATARLDEAIALLRGERAPDALGRALSARGNVTAVEGRYDAALHDFAEARAAFESAGNPLALAILDSNLGGLDMLRFHYAEAAPVFERAAQRFATFGFHAAELNAVCAVAELKLALLDANAALALEPRLRDLIALVTDPARQRNGELTRIQILAANGRLQAASSSLDTVLAAATDAGDRAAIARGHALGAEFALARGEARRAAEEAAAALRHYSAGDDAREHVRTLAVRIAALRADGQTALASATLKDLTRLAGHERNAVAQLYANLARADAADDVTAAGKLYEQALADADALRIPFDLRDAARSYVAWLIGHSDLARAGAVAERVAGWAANDYESALLQLRVYRALGDADLWRSALVRVRALAGERVIPAELLSPPEAP